MQKIIQKGAFTLVELIVVITILAILWTIGFLSFQWYSLSARDSIRVSDLNSISKSLELFKLQEWFYPAPSNPFEVSYSWALAWNQGTFWEATRQKTQRISTIPVDPLTWNEYTYSVTNTRQEFELWAVTENLISYNSTLNNKNSLIPSNTVNAENSFFSYIKWNYNKQIVTVKDTVNTDRLYILWVPTIITTEITDVTVQDLLTNQSFAIDGLKNLPSSYALTLPEWQTHTWATSFSNGPVTLAAPLIYSGTSDDLSDDSNKQQFWEDLISYYAGSNINNQGPYNTISEIQAWSELSYVNTLITTNTWGIPGKDIIVNTVVTQNNEIVLEPTWIPCVFGSTNFNECDFQ